MQNTDLSKIVIDQLSLPEFTEKNIEVSVLRLDKIHPVISGNKWFKLRFYLEEAITLHKKKIVTFGGAWSNHIIATAAACQLNGIGSIGIIRGERAPELSPTLREAKEMDMQLVFISREDYGQKKIPEEFKNDDHYFIPEGGYGIKGAAGAATISDHYRKENYTHICCATGTGTMIAGLINSSAISTRITGISVLKNNFELVARVNLLTKKPCCAYEIIHDYHFGGYAKHKPELIQFMNDYYRQTRIPSDFVYTGKLFYAIHDLVAKDHFPRGSRILLIHSGGLQGNDSLGKGTLIF
jgi:1-aminocyclopropane-1-carboxylate deaminase